MKSCYHHFQCIFTLFSCFILLWTMVVAAPFRGSPINLESDTVQGETSVDPLPKFEVTRLDIPVEENGIDIDCSYSEYFKTRTERSIEMRRPFPTIVLDTANHLLQIEGRPKLGEEEEFLIHDNIMDFFKGRIIYKWIENVFVPQHGVRVKDIILKHKKDIQGTFTRAELLATNFLNEVFSNGKLGGPIVHVVSTDTLLELKRNGTLFEARFIDFTQYLTPIIAESVPKQLQTYFTFLIAIYQHVQNSAIEEAVYNRAYHMCIEKAISTSNQENGDEMDNNQQEDQMNEEEEDEDEEVKIEKLKSLAKIDTLDSAYLTKEFILPLGDDSRLVCSNANKYQQKAFDMDKSLQSKSKIFIQHLNKMLAIQNQPKLSKKHKADILRKPYNIFELSLLSTWQENLLPKDAQRVSRIFERYPNLFHAANYYFEFMLRTLPHDDEHSSSNGNKLSGYLFERNGSQFMAHYLSPNALFTDELLQEFNNQELQNEFRSLLTTYDEYLNEFVERTMYIAQYSACKQS